ncbi:MAG: CBS domain-containing protein [Deltaproteobacteria bacterium]|nr:CBS domain-containing protein [Deltaproteobacteria bacterium]
MIVITTHRNTDFDALASVMAGTLLYPGGLPVIPRNVNPNVKAFLSIHKDIFKFSTVDMLNLDAVEKLVVVDVNRWERLGGLKALRGRDNLEVVIWDHHMSSGNIDAHWICHEKTGSTITLMVRELKKKRKLITPMQATLFLTGLYEDTGNLTFSSTTAEDAYTAAWLIERKADLSIVNTFLKPAYGEKQKNILFRMLQSAERKDLNGYKVSLCRVAVNGHVDSLAVVVRMFREILNLDAAFGLFMDNKRDICMVIGRGNDATALDIGSIMKGLGGGGHPGAGSAMLKSVSPAAVEELIVGLITGNQTSSIQISDIMSFPVATVDAGVSMEKTASILRSKGCTGLPVVEDGKLVGVISRRDFRKIKKESSLKAPVKAYMSRNIVTIEPGKSPMEASRLMVKHDVGRLPVVEGGRLIGIVTRSDAMMYFYDQLPD